MSFPDHSSLKLSNKLDGSQVTVYLQGAHVTSWCTRDGEEHLYTSPKALYADGKAIRGGVPLIFPQFSDLGPLPVSHGFLRVSHGWRLASCGYDGAKRVAVLSYDMACGDDVKGFEGARATLLYTIGFTASVLSLSMSVKNVHPTNALTFGFAFHSYFGVHDITKARLSGFDEAEWLDDLQDRKKCAPQAIHDIHEEVDRIYLNQDQHAVSVTTASSTAAGGAPKTLTIVGSNLTEAVLWNPWVDKTRGMSDMPEDGYRRFVCVEHGRIIEKPTIQPGGEFTGTQTITIS